MITRKNKVKDLVLQPWSEVMGECVKIVAEKRGTTLILKMSKTYRLHLPVNKENFHKLQGHVISILRSDNMNKPFLIREIASGAKSTDKSEV